MLINKLITGLILVFLAGCASVSDKGGSKLEQMDGESGIELEEADKETAISPEVLYLLMAADIAGQRKLYGVALDGYLAAAKRVNDPRITERAAKIGLFLKDTEKTDEAVSIWLKQDEKNLTARKIAVLSAFRSQDKELAEEHLNKLLEDDPAGFESSLMDLSKFLQKDGKADFVFDVLEGVAKQHPDQAAVFFVQALLAGQMNKVELARDKVDLALALEPEWTKALNLRAQIAVQTHDLGLAREIFERVLEKEPDNDLIRKMLAQVLLEAKEYDDAEQLYQDILDDKPDDGESQFAIALINLEQKKYDDAQVYLKKLVNKPAWDSQASFYLGRIDLKKGQYETAIVWFDKVTREPYVYDSSMAAVSALLQQKKHVEAEQRLQGLSVKFPKQKINILLLQAEIYNEQKQHQKAFDILTETLEQFPEHRDLLYTRALVSEKLNRLDLLEADLKKILIKNPNDAGVLNALGYTLVDRTERYQDAEIYLQKALKLKPEEAVIIDSFGWLQYKLGKTSVALEYLQKAYAIQPENEIGAHLAEVLWIMGQKTEAKKVYQERLKLSPDDEYLLKFRQQFLDSDKQ